MKIEDFIKSLQEIAENHPGIEVKVASTVVQERVYTSPLLIYERIKNNKTGEYDEYALVL